MKNDVPSKQKPSEIKFILVTKLRDRDSETERERERERGGRCKWHSANAIHKYIKISRFSLPFPSPGCVVAFS